MRLHRFFVNFPLEHTLETITDGRLIHQWRDVFRYNVGSQVILFDGSGKEYNSVLEKLTNRQAEVRLVLGRQGIVPKIKIVLYQSLIKKDKFEWVVEKATELGVSKIVPVVSERSEKKGINMERLNKIAIEASEQCGRADVLVVEESKELVASIQEAEGEIIVFDPRGEKMNHDIAPSPNPLPEGEGAGGGENSSLHNSNSIIHNSISIFVGPEGGWSEKELNLFKQKGARVFSLGPLILRSETAAIAALARLTQ